MKKTSCERNLRPLSEALARKAAAELNENPADLDYYLDSLREWAERQPHIKSRTSDQFLIVFLRSAKFSLERAKQKVDNFYTYRSLMPEIFLNRDPDSPKVQAIIKSGCVLHLPEPVADDGARVILIRPSLFDISKHTIPEVFKIASMATDLLLYEDDNAMVAGYEVIFDLANISSSVMMSFDPTFVKKLTILANKISPSRMKAFHVLNVAPLFEKLFNMVKSVINVKLRNRFYFYGNKYEDLYERIPQRILPKEYGGECDVEAMQIGWLAKLKANKDFYREEESYGVIMIDHGKLSETLWKTGTVTTTTTTTKSANDESCFGMNGSFRQLNLD